MMTRDEMRDLSTRYANNGGDLLRMFGHSPFESAAQCIISLYAMFKKSTRSKCGAFEYFEKTCGENASAKVQSVKEMIEHAKQQATQEMLYKCEDYSRLVKATILFYERSTREPDVKNAITPELSSLIGKLLAEGAKTITNINMGRAGFLRDSFAEFNEDVERFGSEEDVADYLCSLIRAEVMGIPFENFNCQSLLEENEKLDRFFAMIPFGYHKPVQLTEGSVAESFAKCNPDLFNERMPEWFYAGYLADKLNYNGKGAMLMAPSLFYTSIQSSVSARKNMLENGRISAVIEITNRKLYKNTSINVSLVIVGKNCSSVRFVYANMKDNYETDTLTDEEIQAIVNACNGDEVSIEFGNIHTATKTVEELLEDKNCSLEPRHHAMIQKQTGMNRLSDYLPETEGTQKGKPIFRSRIFSSKQIKSNFIDEETVYKYIEISNLENGAIGGDIQNLNELPKELKNYLVKDGDILISRAATPNYKVAVAEFGEDAPFKEGDEVLPGSNIYVIRVDKNLASPYFIKAWLESDRGQDELKNISTSSVLSTLRVEKLRELCVPATTLEEQREFTEVYKKFTREIQGAKLRLDAKNKQLKNFTEEFFATEK